MRRLVKLVVILGLVCAALAAASYAGSRVTVGKIVGSRPTELGPRKIRFAFKGVEELPRRPRAWVYSYGPTVIPGMREATIFVSPLGLLLGSKPSNLAERLARYRDAN